MAPNRFRGYEYVFLLIFTASIIASAIQAGAVQYGIQLSPAVSLALFVITTVSVPLANRLEAFGSPQGNQVVLNVTTEPGTEVATTGTVQE